MTERRFNEAEVAAIFQRATEAQQADPRQLPSSEGMTLAHLQDIGKEVGISPDLIAKAAHALTREGRSTTRRFLGLPIGVGRTIELGRNLTDEEWERVVVELRETFDARGTMRTEGSLRQWTNGNLQALLEPTATGHRLRLKTIKGDARGMIVGGLGMIGAATAAMIFTVLSGGVGEIGALATYGFVGGMGATMFGVGAARLPSWARERESQMAALAEKLVPDTAPLQSRITESEG